MVGDVSDKGVPAALFMALTYSIIRAESYRSLNPGEVLQAAQSLGDVDQRGGRDSHLVGCKVSNFCLLGVVFFHGDAPACGLGGVALPGQGVGNVQARGTQQLFGLARPLRHQLVLLAQALLLVQALLDGLGRAFVARRHFAVDLLQLLERGLVTEESDQHQYRTVDIVDVDTNKPIFQIEHEVRSMKHPMFNRVFVNRNADMSNRNFVPVYEVGLWALN